MDGQKPMGERRSYPFKIPLPRLVNSLGEWLHLGIFFAILQITFSVCPTSSGPHSSRKSENPSDYSFTAPQISPKALWVSWSFLFPHSYKKNKKLNWYFRVWFPHVSLMFSFDWAYLNSGELRRNRPILSFKGLGFWNKLGVTLSFLRILTVVTQPGSAW